MGDRALDRARTGDATTAGTLVLRHAGGTVEVERGDDLLVGRGADADLTIDKPGVSRHHARFYYEDGWRVADQSSTNGTFVEGRRVTDVPLSQGAVVRLGSPEWDVLLTIESGGAEPHDGFASTVLKGAGPQPFRDTPAPPPVAVDVPVITIGKATDNDVVVDDINASRHHARLYPQLDGFLVEDLNSLNGTLLNAVPIQRGFMRDGDRLTIGNSDFVRHEGALVPARLVAAPAGLTVEGVDFVVGQKRLIDGVTFTADRGTLTAVIGPSGAGKSTLSRLLVGVTEPSAGRVSFDGFDLQRDYRAVKTRVGLVPQDDVVHRQLALATALRYAADLRLPKGLPGSAKEAQVGKVLTQLGLEERADQRIERLSGGQRKRASVAMELLTEPALLILDEPTSGLDPALDRQVMLTLRQLADGDRTVVVITHSVAYLGVCDQVLVLAPGGMTAFYGSPDDIAKHFGTDDWGDIFAGLATDPAGFHRRWLGAADVAASRPEVAPEPARKTASASSWFQQLRTLSARQVKVMLADRGYVAFLLALSVILGLLPYVVPGSVGLTAVPRNQPDHATEPTSVLALLITGATFLGIAMTIRDLVGERAIFLREKAVGLHPSAYLIAKLVVYGAASLLLTAIMTAVLTLVKKAPTHEVMGFGPPLVELYLPIALTMWVAAALGLAISAFATSNEQVMPALILVLMVQLVFHGGLIPVLDRDVLNAVSKFVPGRWGFAAGASSIDLEALLAPGRPLGSPPMRHDPLWAHTQRQWITDMTVLGLFGVVFSAIAGVRLRVGRR